MGTKRTKISDEEISAAARAVANGSSYVAAGAALGIAGNCIRRLMKRRGFHTPPRKRAAPPLRLPRSMGALGYIAGIFDGEGTIVNVRGAWYVNIYSTNRELIDWLLTFGGLSYTRPVKEASSPLSRKDGYVWNIAARDSVLCFVSALTPFLIIKRDIAARALTDLQNMPKLPPNRLRAVQSQHNERVTRRASKWSSAEQVDTRRALRGR